MWRLLPQVAAFRQHHRRSPGRLRGSQAQAARTSWEFIQNVGLYTEGEEKKTVNVSFQFIKDGHMAQITVPLLTIVPIPYIAINSIDINFKANISASAASTETENSSSS